MEAALPLRPEGRSPRACNLMDCICLAQLNPIVGDLQGNQKKIIAAIQEAQSLKADLVVFPELAITGYPPEDFLLMPHFIQAAERVLHDILPRTKGLTAIIGLPRFTLEDSEKKLYNSAAICFDGKLLGFQDKSLLPTYDVFDERRYFEPAQKSHIFEIKGVRLAVTICEDIWQHGALVGETTYRHDPVLDLQKQGVDLVVNLSASPYAMGRFEDRLKTGVLAARSLGCRLYLCNQVGANDSLIFDGRSYAIDSSGRCVGIAPAFKEGVFELETNPPTSYEEIALLHEALVIGIRDYFTKQNFKKACLGLSGGIDSAVVACLAAEALGPKEVLAVAMPSRFSSRESSEDACELVERLGIVYKTIAIESLHHECLELLAPHFEGKKEDATEENIQARIRGLLLMALSNKHGFLVLSTGNKSEMAMGYVTLYGDLCGGLAVLSDVTKGLVYELALYINRDREIIPRTIIEKAPSAELKANQKDEDSLPPYSVIDEVLSRYVEGRQSPDQIVQETGFDLGLVHDLIRKIHASEYKRRQSPPGLRVTQKAFSVGRRFPIVQGWSSYSS